MFRNGLGEWQQVDRQLQRSSSTASPRTSASPTSRSVSPASTRTTSSSDEDAANVYKEYYTKPPEGATVESGVLRPAALRSDHGARRATSRSASRSRSTTRPSVKKYKKYIEGGGEKGAHTEFAAEMMFRLGRARSSRRLPGPGASRAVARPRVGRREDKALTDSLSKKAKSLVEVEGTFTEVVNTRCR